MELPSWKDEKALLAFTHAVNRQPVKVARALVPERSAGYVRAVRDLAGLAGNRMAELYCLRVGDQLGADVYRLCIEAIRDRMGFEAQYLARQGKWKL